MRQAFSKALRARSLQRAAFMRRPVFGILGDHCLATMSPVSRSFSTTPPWTKAVKVSAMEERVTDLSPKCQACGTPFQHKDPAARGFYKDLVSSARGESVQTSTSTKYNQLMTNLDEQTQKVLLEERKSDLEPWQRHQVEDEQEGQQKSEINIPVTERLRMTLENSDKMITKTKWDGHKEMINRGLCTSCREVKGGKYMNVLGDRPSQGDLLAKIPKDAAIIHVISGIDFPASVNPKIKDIAAGRKIFWVVTKSDMIVPDRSKTTERLLPYVRAELSREYDADPEDVYVISPKRGWEIDNLYHNLPTNSYLVGCSNTGKTTLAQALARKDKNRAIIPAQLMQRLVGANEIPGMTRGEINYVLKGKRITDMPPIGKGQDAIYSVVKENMIKDLVKGKPFLRQSGLITTTRSVLSKPGNTLSLGGLVFLTLNDSPSKLSLIVWSPCALHDDVVQRFRDYDKAITTAAEQRVFHSEWFFSKPYDPTEEPNRVPRKVMDIMVPKGGIDLSVLGLGHVQLRGNGLIPREGVSVSVYAIPGVSVVQKMPLLPFLKDFREHTPQRTQEKPKRRAGSK